MDGGTRHAGAVEVVRQLLAHALGAREHKRLAVALPFHEASFVQDGLQLLVFVEALDHADLLDHILVRLQFISVSDHDLEGLVQDLRGEFSDLPGPSRREKQRLALLVYLGQDLSDLGLEAHVEHPIGLVEHTVAHLAAIHDPIVAEVVQPARRGDEAVGALLDLPLLLRLLGTAIGASRCDLHRLAELLGVAKNLEAELARRRHAEQGRPLGGVDLASLLQLPDFDEAGEQECQGLAAARLRNTDQVLAGL
mmetsp:Transcript_69265/g.195510  ORF Transcript_69265/g.195510 Transcript_69265/m.195510 type:complete len:252 (-) Transcript_69265:288-1043(-)